MRLEWPRTAAKPMLMIDLVIFYSAASTCAVCLPSAKLRFKRLEAASIAFGENSAYWFRMARASNTMHNANIKELEFNLPDCCVMSMKHIVSLAPQVRVCARRARVRLRVRARQQAQVQSDGANAYINNASERRVQSAILLSSEAVVQTMRKQLTTTCIGNNNQESNNQTCSDCRSAPTTSASLWSAACALHWP